MTADNEKFDGEFEDSANDSSIQDESHNDAAGIASHMESIHMKEKIRDQLHSDIEAFLQRGGQVQSIDDNVRADPPRKPDQQYGSGPI